jgi:tyrosinase
MLIACLQCGKPFTRIHTLLPKQLLALHTLSLKAMSKMPIPVSRNPSTSLQIILTFTSALTPFHKDTNGNFWTSNLVRDWRVFHYTYPEYSNSDGSASSIMSYVNQMYGPSATATAGNIKYKKRKRSLLQPREISPNITLANAPVSLISTPDGLRYEYTANIATQRFALDGSYNIYVFLGNFSANPASWPFDQALVGTYGVFSTKGMTGMQGNHSVSGTVPLTRALTAQITAGRLANLQTQTVATYLQSNLQWRVASSNGTEIPAQNVPGLQVSVVTANATVPASEDVFPVFGAWDTLTSVTDARAGGLGDGMTVAYEAAKVEARARGFVGRD